MSNRSALCAERAAIERVSQPLGTIEARVPSRNAAHLISRARSLSDAAAAVLSQALAHPVDAIIDVVPGRASCQ